MRNKIFIIMGLIFAISFFSGCSNKTVEDEIKNEKMRIESQESVNDSLKVDTNELIETEQPVFEEGMEIGTIQKLLDKKENLKCSWRVEKEETIEEADIDNKDEDAGGGIEDGVIYIGEGKFKQEMKIKENSREIAVDVLNDGEFIYQWSSISRQGTKTEIDSAREMGVLDAERNYFWNCEDWEMDENIFKSPAEIEFVELETF